MKLEIEVTPQDSFTYLKSDFSGLNVSELLGSGIKSAKEGNRADARQKL